jgi:hypothetical protein
MIFSPKTFISVFHSVHSYRVHLGRNILPKSLISGLAVDLLWAMESKWRWYVQHSCRNFNIYCIFLPLLRFLFIKNYVPRKKILTTERK